MIRLIDFEKFNESKLQEDINKLQKNLRDKITKLVDNWKDDVDDKLYDLLDNYSYKNMKVTWDLSPDYSISKYNREITTDILQRCNLLYKLTFILKKDEVDDFLFNFFDVKEFLKSYSNTDIIIEELIKKGNRYRRPYKIGIDFPKIVDDLGLEKKLKDILEAHPEESKSIETLELIVKIF